MPELSKFEQEVQQAALWIRAHQERFWTVVGAIAVAAILLVFAYHRHEQENAAAWTELGAVQGQLLQGKYDDAKKSIAHWEERYAQTQANGYERFLKADLLYRTSDYAQSAQVYAGLAENAPSSDMKPLALSAEAGAEEMAGHFPQAQATAQRFTQTYPDHFLAANAYLAQARLADLQGNSAAATAAYDRFLMLFPQHPLAAVAKARRQALSGAAPPSKPVAP